MDIPRKFVHKSLGHRLYSSQQKLSFCSTAKRIVHIIRSNSTVTLNFSRDLNLPAARSRRRLPSIVALKFFEDAKRSRGFALLGEGAYVRKHQNKTLERKAVELPSDVIAFVT